MILIALLAPGVCLPAPIGDYTARLAVGDWTPDDVDAVNALDMLKHDSAMYVRTPILFTDYRYQYFGIVRDNTRILMLNAFCSKYWKHAEGWRQHLIVVKDGGACFFHAEYSMKEHRILSVVFNGVA